MENTIEGKIISQELGTFGKTQIIYGYIGIEKPNGEHVKVKVDSYTLHETLEVGSQVFVKIAHLGTTDIIVARRIDINQDPIFSTKSKATANA
jgi:hypothetical protein